MQLLFDQLAGVAYFYDIQSYLTAKPEKKSFQTVNHHNSAIEKNLPPIVQ